MRLQSVGFPLCPYLSISLDDEKGGKRYLSEYTQENMHNPKHAAWPSGPVQKVG